MGTKAGLNRPYDGEPSYYIALVDVFELIDGSLLL